MTKEQLEEKKKIIYELICDPQYVPMKIKEMAILLELPKERRGELEEVLNALLESGKIELSNKGKYSKARGRVAVGRFIGNVRGFGFVEIDGESDIFIPEEKVHGAMNGDTVKVAISPGQRGKRLEGSITSILEHATTRLVGSFDRLKGFGFVLPDNAKMGQDIYVALSDSMDAQSGAKVVVELTRYGTEGKRPEGRIVEILGDDRDPGVDILSILRAYELPTEFPEEVEMEAQNRNVPVAAGAMEGRLDLRNLLTITIDGEDAKDLDDAITLRKEEDGYRLGVHIADVSHYVQEGSLLDGQARERGTSVYLVDRVIPMLPKDLSNGICSLNEGVDRLALSCIKRIDCKGNVIEHEIAETVICVNHRMSYTSVKKILADADPAEIKAYEDLVPNLREMEELAAVLRGKRRKRGSIDFDFPETKVLLDEKGRARDLCPYERNVATRMIEEFMLVANETVAQDAFWQDLPFVYRSHENPDFEKMKGLAALVGGLGFSLRLGQEELHPKELQKLMERIEGSPQEDFISRLLLRSMKRAKYTTECTGHFGLATTYYCHFTSPIRRYPDLQIHRILKENLHGALGEKRREHFSTLLPEVATHSSQTERRADEAEREVLKLKKAEYMEQHLGEEYEGMISSITSWGIYVELPNTVEGLLHVSRLEGDFYHYQEETYEMVGEVTGRRFKLGQKIKVGVAGVDRLTRTIDFYWVKE